MSIPLTFNLMSSYVQNYPGSPSSLTLTDEPPRERKPDYLFCVDCLNLASGEGTHHEEVLSITCTLYAPLDLRCEGCSRGGKPVCHTTPMGMLGEAYRFIQILNWARRATATAPEPKAKGLIRGINQAPIHSYLHDLSLPVFPAPYGPDWNQGELSGMNVVDIPWGSYPGVQDVARLASAQLSFAFVQAIDAHLSQYDLKIAEPYEPTKYIQYQTLMTQKLHLQYEVLKKPIQFPHTLCRLGPEDGGFVIWQSAIRSFFEAIASEIERKNGSNVLATPNDPMEVALHSHAVRTEASRYTLPW